MTYVGSTTAEPATQGAAQDTAPYTTRYTTPYTTLDGAPAVNATELHAKVQAVYSLVAETPHAEFHFELGRELAERLGYPTGDLDRIPAEAIDSFAGVGYHLDLARLRPGNTVVDLGSGSGTDCFAAALQVGESGQVIGIDMTRAQLDKAEALRQRQGVNQVRFVESFIERLPLADESVDAVISNGVINLSADKEGVFREAARVLRTGGRLAISDIVTEKQLTDKIVGNASLWAACIGGASQIERYQEMIDEAGLVVVEVRSNPQYGFLSGSAQGATKTYGVKSISLVAIKR